jgi:hypothetical protein
MKEDPNKTPQPEEKKTQKAEPLAVCTLSNTPEHVRADDMGEPCDDGRAG